MQNVPLYSKFYFLHSGSVLWFAYRGVELLISRTAPSDCCIITDGISSDSAADLRPALYIRWIIVQVGEDDPRSASTHSM